MAVFWRGCRDRSRGTCCCAGSSTGGAAAGAGAVVTGKVANCRTVVQRAIRDNPGGAGVGELEHAALRLGRLVETVSSTQGLEEIRGHEGDAARVYFGGFGHLITASKEGFFFR